jgi:hypothetical protein
VSPTEGSFFFDPIMLCHRFCANAELRGRETVIQSPYKKPQHTNMMLLFESGTTFPVPLK